MLKNRKYLSAMEWRVLGQIKNTGNIVKLINSLYALLLAIILMPDVTSAQVCPGTNHNATGKKAIAYAGPANTTTLTFIGTGCSSGVTGASFPPTSCLARYGTGWVALSALWSTTSKREMASASAGCSFMCGFIATGRANTCFVRAEDGLPVELMEFGVE